MRKVLVTGGSGFIASHLIQQLLERGVAVNATVRDLANPLKVGPLRELDRDGRLELFEADLLTPGSFDGAIQGCDTVFHVASPFKFPEHIHDGQKEMVEPALEGTRNVLAAVDATLSVDRVVLTSTIGAIFGDYVDVLDMANETLTENYFNTTSTVENNAYHFSKVCAEKEAWAIHDAQARWSMVAICPALVLGPSLSPGSESGSLALLDEMMRGEFWYGAPGLSFATVDVREVALAHIRAAERASATGRFIVSNSRMHSFLEMARHIKPVHRRPIVLPKQPVPDFLVKLVGPHYGIDREFCRKHLGITFGIDNHRGVEELGITYRPIRETLQEHYRSWAAAR